MNTNYIQDEGYCDHFYEKDMIDIDPDRSQMIYRCNICGYMTNNLISKYKTNPIEMNENEPTAMPPSSMLYPPSVVKRKPTPPPPPSPPQNKKPWKDVLFDYIRGVNISCRHSSPEPQPDFQSESGYSSISIDQSPQNDQDLQSIIIKEDIQELSVISIEDTVPFTPNIQYGKVLEVKSPRDIIIASRIYNGYTKMLKPRLYRFHITLKDIPYFGIHEEQITVHLTTMILDKIVVINNTYTHPESNIIFAEIYLNGIDINRYLLELYPKDV